MQSNSLNPLWEREQSTGDRQFQVKKDPGFKWQKKELGNLDRLRDVLDHWKSTGRGVNEISTKEATELFIAYKQKVELP
jgi:hypothetical protein